MPLIAARHAHTPQRDADLTATLSRWYAANASIRRLLAIEDAAAVKVFVVLEPSSDGDDALPVWLANARTWERNLASLIARDVRLELFEAVGPAAPIIVPDTFIAHLHWRDFWDSPQ